MKAEIFATGDQFTLALLNAAWEGLLLVVFTHGCLRVLGRTNAATRYAAWLALLLVLGALVPAHFWYARLECQASVPAPLLAGPGSSARFASLEPALDLNAMAKDSAAIPAALPLANFSAPATPDPIRPSKGSPISNRAPIRHWLGRSFIGFNLRTTVPRSTGLIVTLVWATIALFKLCHLGWGMLGIRNLKRQSRAASIQADQILERLRVGMRVTRCVNVRVSPACRSAIVLGFVHPTILLPAEEDQDLAALEQVIGHELAHIRRRDDWANLAQRTLEALFFFNPAVGWVSSELALEREIACDDCVLQRGSRPQEYALLLVNLAGRKLSSPLPLATGVSTGKAQLQHRIDMIMQTHRNTSPRLAAAKLGFVTTATAVLVVLFLNAAPRVARAEDASTATSPATAAVAAETSVAQDDIGAESGPAHVGHGPRSKPKAETDEDVQVAPVPPAPPSLSAPPPPPRTPKAADRSIDERLDRLERMVDFLVAQQKRSLATIVRREPGDSDDRAEAHSNFEYRVDGKREAARAAEAEKRATKQAVRAKKLEEKFRENNTEDGFKAQVQALEQARQTLEREMQKLDQQLQQVRRDHEKIQAEQRTRATQDGEGSDDSAPTKK